MSCNLEQSQWLHATSILYADDSVTCQLPI